jgi:hypothetical protein
VTSASGIEPTRISAALAPPAFLHAFEPISPNAIGRFWGIGPGRGFHVVPVGPYQARYHHSVSSGGMPREEDYHPNQFGTMLSAPVLDPIAGGWHHIPESNPAQETWVLPQTVAPVQPLPNLQTPRLPPTTGSPAENTPPNRPTAPKTNQLEKQDAKETGLPEEIPLPSKRPLERNENVNEKGWSDTDPALSPNALDKLFQDEVHPSQDYQEPKVR